MAKTDPTTISATPAPERRPRAVGGWRNAGQTYGGLAALVLLILFNIIFTPHFLSLQTLNTNLVQVAPTAIVAAGMTLVIATGGIDLSVGSLMAIAGSLAPLIFLGKLLPLGDSTPLGNILGIIIAILVTSLLGLFNGTLVTVFRIQPIIATLILFIAGRGIAQVLTNGNLQDFSNPGFLFLGQGRVLGIPFQVILMIIVIAVVAVVVRTTTFGRYLLAIGGNEAASRLSGIPVSNIKRTVYVISGALAGVAGLIIIAINSSSDANQVGLNGELDAIAAVAVGGTPLTGGQANVVGTLVGALIIQLIRTTLIANNVSPDIAQVINAVIILLAVYVQRQRKAS